MVRRWPLVTTERPGARHLHRLSDSGAQPVVAAVGQRLQRDGGSLDFCSPQQRWRLAGDCPHTRAWGVSFGGQGAFG